jgi:FAD/FMN-containing dehydrogenase
MVLTGGIPKLILLAEFSGNDDVELDEKVHELSKRMKKFKWKTRIATSTEDAEKYWTIRRESFNLLRKHVRGRRTAPFIDDVVVNPEYLPEFLPKIRKILDTHKLLYTIAGHAGNGNFHIIPLMDMRLSQNADAIKNVSEEVYALVAEYHGSITGEHNDGIVRTPYLHTMYSPKIMSLFKETKDLFDPQGMFNPGKKVGITVDYMMAHLAKE